MVDQSPAPEPEPAPEPLPESGTPVPDGDVRQAEQAMESVEGAAAAVREAAGVVPGGSLDLPELDETDVESVELDREKAGLALRIASGGQERFERLTRGLIGRRLAVDVGSTRVSSPVVQMPMRTTLFIDGGLDELSPADMRDLQALIESPLSGLRLRLARGRATS